MLVADGQTTEVRIGEAGVPRPLMSKPRPESGTSISHPAAQGRLLGLRTRTSKRWRLSAILGSMLAGILAWASLAAIVSVYRPNLTVFLPSPAKVLVAGYSMVQTAEFWAGMATTNLRVVAGFVLAVSLSVPLGVVLGSFPMLERLASPLMDFGRYVPVAALVPLSILWAGVGDAQKILVLAIGTFFPMLVLVADAVRRVPIMHVESALTLGASRIATVRSVLLRAALPQIFDACRVGINLTWSYLLVAEIVASDKGLGYIIIRGQRFLQTDRIVFTIIVLGCLGLVYDRLFTVARPILFPWAVEEAEG